MIKIDGTSSATSPKSAAKKAKRGAHDNAFSSLMGSLSAENNISSAPAASDMSVSSLDMILSVQGLPEDVTRRQDNIRQAHLTLDSLETLRNGLLMGTVPTYLLHDLERRMIDMRNEETDPVLLDIIEDIELRAAVEVAKFRMGQ